MNYFEREKPLGLVCYNCGSFDIVLLNKAENRLIYRCQTCGKVWFKRDVNGYEKH